VSAQEATLWCLPFGTWEGVSGRKRGRIESKHDDMVFSRRELESARWSMRLAPASLKYARAHRRPTAKNPLSRPILPVRSNRKKVGREARDPDQMPSTSYSICRGQRMGFSRAPAFWKIDMMAMLARNTEPLIVIGLIGERGPRVQQFIPKRIWAKKAWARRGGRCLYRGMRRRCLRKQPR